MLKLYRQILLQMTILDWYARGGIHTPNAPCDGTALKGWLSISGIASWVKEIWFPGGYTDQRDIVHATSDDNRS